MSDRQYSFETPAHTRLQVEIPNGEISVTAAETATTEVVLSAPRGDAAALDWIAQATITQVGNEITVRGPRLSIRLLPRGPIEARVRTPFGSDANLSIGAGRIETRGRLGKLTANNGAGAVKLDDCAEAHARLGAGNVEIGQVTGSVDAKSGAGDVTVATIGADANIVTGLGDARIGAIVGSAKFNMACGNIAVGRAGDSLEMVTVAGNIEVDRADHGRIKARTVSGSVSVGVPSGVAALLEVSTLSGRVRSDLAGSDAPRDGEAHVELKLNTVSGDVKILRA